MVTEMLEVLQRSELTRKFTSLAALDLRRVLELLGEAEVVEPVSLVARNLSSVASRDPDVWLDIGTGIRYKPPIMSVNRKAEFLRGVFLGGTLLAAGTQTVSAAEIGG